MNTVTSAYPDDRVIAELAQSHGLKLCPVIFEMVPASVLYEFAAYLIPGRMAHWSFGKQYQLLKLRYDYGLGKLYEMVVNTNPAYAFLLESNSSLENTMVRCHVFGHVDFFQTNYVFEPTHCNMIDVVSHHADRIRQYEFQYGRVVVEALLDSAMAIEEHVDWAPPDLSGLPPARAANDRGEADAGYPDLKPAAAKGSAHRSTRASEYPAWDLLDIIVRHSDGLDSWQRDVVSMVREEMQYFWPQIRTKIMNEGWATYWHIRLMQELDLSDSDYVDYARLSAAVTAPHDFQINPYGLGVRVFEDISRRFGEREMFFCREVEDDVSFVRNHLTQEIVDDLHLFVFGRDQQNVVVKSKDWKIVRDQLLHELTHGGVPVISVEDGDFHHRGELYLLHHHDGVDLDLPYAEQTLKHVFKLWGRPVHLDTVSSGRRMVLTAEGDTITQVLV